MLRRLTVDMGKLGKVGDLKDYPAHVWNKIALDRANSRKLRLKRVDPQKELASFSDPVEDTALQNPLRRVHLKSRLGATAQ